MGSNHGGSAQKHQIHVQNQYPTIQMQA
jgi:hypothetical protein